MAAGIIVPMLRMGVDPVLQSSADGDFTNTKLSVDDITSVPQRVEWTVEQDDGGYEDRVRKTAEESRDEGDNIIAHCPICKHLGCFVTWEGSDDFPDEYFCPCHDGRYYKDGTNVPGTPPLAPLDEFEQKVENGILYLGAERPRGEA